MAGEIPWGDDGRPWSLFYRTDEGTEGWVLCRVGLSGAGFGVGGVDHGGEVADELDLGWAAVLVGGRDDDAVDQRAGGLAGRGGVGALEALLQPCEMGAVSVGEARVQRGRRRPAVLERGGERCALGLGRLEPCLQPGAAQAAGGATASDAPRGEAPEEAKPASASSMD